MPSPTKRPRPRDPIAARIHDLVVRDHGGSVLSASRAWGLGYDQLRTVCLGESRRGIPIALIQAVCKHTGTTYTALVDGEDEHVTDT